MYRLNDVGDVPICAPNISENLVLDSKRNHTLKYGISNGSDRYAFRESHLLKVDQGGGTRRDLCGRYLQPTPDAPFIADIFLSKAGFEILLLWNNNYELQQKEYRK
jgi:hypothetical protein